MHLHAFHRRNAHFRVFGAEIVAAGASAALKSAPASSAGAFAPPVADGSSAVGSKRNRGTSSAAAATSSVGPGLAELLPASSLGPAAASSGTHAKRPKLYQGEGAEEDGVEFFSRLRISKRTVPSQDVRMALAGRTVHRIKALADGPASRFTPAAGPGGEPSRAGADWVTVGVLASRSAPQIGRTGNTYATWRLTDFQADVTVLLFGEAYEAHKHDIMEGSVVLLSHPSVLPAKERSSFALSVSAGAQLTKLGTCPVFAICKASRKDGNRCTMVRTAAAADAPHAAPPMQCFMHAWAAALGAGAMHSAGTVRCSFLALLFLRIPQLRVPLSLLPLFAFPSPSVCFAGHQHGGEPVLRAPHGGRIRAADAPGDGRKRRPDGAAQL